MRKSVLSARAPVLCIAGFQIDLICQQVITLPALSMALSSGFFFFTTFIFHLNDLQLFISMKLLSSDQELS